MCTATTCAMGFAECVAGAPACETQLGTTANCRSCNETCTNPHVTTTCSLSSGCSPSCDDGWKSCDGIADNGCERDIRTLTNCGDCDVPCSYLNAAASCSTGVCTMGACNTGFADCSTATTGCETQLGTASNCAACVNACTNAHGTNSCTGTPGSFDCSPVCDDAWSVVALHRGSRPLESVLEFRGKRIDTENYGTPIVTIMDRLKRDQPLLYQEIRDHQGGVTAGKQ